jgi:hypothetical protein
MIQPKFSKTMNLGSPNSMTHMNNPHQSTNTNYADTIAAKNAILTGT